MASGQYTVGTTSPAQDFSSAGGTNAYCLAAPTSTTAEPATFAAGAVAAGTLSLVPGSSLAASFP